MDLTQRKAFGRPCLKEAISSPSEIFRSWAGSCSKISVGERNEIKRRMITIHVNSPLAVHKKKEDISLEIMVLKRTSCWLVGTVKQNLFELGHRGLI